MLLIAREEKSKPLPKKRARKSRFIKIGKDKVLKENNYTLEEGIQTYTGSDFEKLARSLPRIKAAKNAFMLFSAAKRPSLPRNLRADQAMAELGLMWATLPDDEKEPFMRKAKHDKIRHEKELLERKKLLQQMKQEQEDHALAMMLAQESLGNERAEPKLRKPKSTDRKPAAVNHELEKKLRVTRMKRTGLILVS